MWEFVSYTFQSLLLLLHCNPSLIMCNGTLCISLICTLFCSGSFTPSHCFTATVTEVYPHHTFYPLEFDTSVNTYGSSKISLCLHVQMISNTETPCDVCVKDFLGEASNHIPILCNVCSERMSCIWYPFAPPSFWPCPKGWQQSGSASGTDYCEVLNIIMFDEEHEWINRYVNLQWHK